MKTTAYLSGRLPPFPPLRRNIGYYSNRQVSRLITPWYANVFHRIPAPFLPVFYSEKEQSVFTVAEAAGQLAKAISLFPIKSFPQKGYRLLVFNFTCRTVQFAALFAFSPKANRKKRIRGLRAPR